MPRINSGFLPAAILVVLGAAIAIASFNYSLGTVRHLGPGAVPAAMGILIAVFGLVLLFMREDAEPEPPMAEAPGGEGYSALRSLAVVSVAMLLWALLIERLGLVPATAALILASSFAVPGYRLGAALALSASVAALGYLVFIFALRLPIPAMVWN